MSVRLNIGAGDKPIEGFTSIDRRNGEEAYPLKYGNDSVDEIRASHVLEHFGFADVPKVMEEWVRVLKPGGKIRIAVPDFDWIAENRSDPKYPFYAFGGQTNDNDFHKSLHTRSLLTQLMADVGLEDIADWKGDNGDCSSLPVSLNLMGTKSTNGKPAEAPSGSSSIVLPQSEVKIAGVLSIPRYGSNDAWGCIVDALSPWKIPVRRYTGAYWGQCMQTLLEQCVDDNLDLILTMDYDTLFTAKHFDRLLGWICRDPKIDALAALQVHRGKPTPLMNKEGCKETVIDGRPLQVDTAHFGLTLLRVDALRDVEKPWMIGKPDKFGGWGEGRVDPDVWFWNQWKKAGKSLFVAPNVRVGHLTEMVRIFTPEMQYEAITVQEWRDRELGKTGLAKEA